MDSRLYRQTPESFEEYLFRLNEETSLEVLPTLNAKPSRRVGWVNLLFYPLTRSVLSFVRLGGFRGGIKPFIDSVLVGISTLVSMVKIWEYRMRQREGGGLLPPVTKQELERFTQL